MVSIAEQGGAQSGISEPCRYQCDLREVFHVGEFPFDSHLLHVKVRLLQPGWSMVPLDYHELKVRGAGKGVSTQITS